MNQGKPEQEPQSIAELLRKSLSPEEQLEVDYWTPMSAVIVESLHLRTERKLSQSDVARKMGTRQSVISRFENLGRKPSYDFLVRYARALGGTLGLTLNGQYSAVAPTVYRGRIDSEALKTGTSSADIVRSALEIGLTFTVPRETSIAFAGVTASDEQPSKKSHSETVAPYRYGSAADIEADTDIVTAGSAYVNIS